MSIIEKIKAHGQEVLSGNIPSDLEVCPRCEGNPESFKPHDYRGRLFLVIIDGLVQQIPSFLARWRCPLCHRPFTYYPDFAMPYKRYVKDDVLELSRQYVEDDHSSYRDVVQDNASAIGYDSGEDTIDERQLAPSTVWRWLSYVGSLQQALYKALHLIRQKSPSSGIFRQIRPVHVQKYRSHGRKKLLGRCLRLFRAEGEFSPLFGVSIFTHLATPYGLK